MKAKEMTLTLVSNCLFGAGVHELEWEAPEAIEFHSGQFVSMIIPGKGPNGRDLRRAYSIASAPGAYSSVKIAPNRFRLCIKRVEGGAGSSYLCDLAPGDQARGQLPFGDFVYKTQKDRASIFIATGTGIAPFRAMLTDRRLEEHWKNQKSELWFGARQDEELVYPDLSDCMQADIQRFLSRPSGQDSLVKHHARLGRVTDLLRERLASNWPYAAFDYYLCGNGQMIDEVKQLLLERGLVKSQIYQEVYYKPKPGAVHA